MYQSVQGAEPRIKVHGVLGVEKKAKQNLIYFTNMLCSDRYAKQADEKI